MVSAFLSASNGFPPHLPKVDAMSSRIRGLGSGRGGLESWPPAHFLRQLTLRELVHLSLDCKWTGYGECSGITFTPAARMFSWEISVLPYLSSLCFFLLFSIQYLREKAQVLRAVTTFSLILLHSSSFFFFTLKMSLT